MPISEANSVYTITGNVFSNQLTEENIVCEDADGDGYYFWGVGPKPDSLPAWVPDEEDGDDSDYTKGPLTFYGYLQPNNPDSLDTIYIDQSVTFDTDKYTHQHIVVRNNSTLIIPKRLICFEGVRVTVEAGSHILLDGGTLENAILDLQEGSRLTLNNDAEIIHNKNVDFCVPQGASLYQNCGEIE